MSRIVLLFPAVAVVLIAAACSNDSEFHDMSGGGTAGTAGTGSSVSDGGAETSAGAAVGTAGKPGSAGTSSGTGGSKTTGGSTAGGSPAAEAGAGGDAAPGAGGQGVGGQGAGGDGPSTAACPDIFGAYSITSSDGECGTLNEDAAQSIQGTNVACYAHFVSTPPSGAQGVNGGAALDMSGDFAGATLYLDSVQRNPCSGTYSATAKTMTVKCGGVGDLCTVVLERKK